jgi:drug/metabolite transporter (DMT)-like permease
VQLMKKLGNAPYFLLVLSAVFWGGNAVAGKYLAGSIPPVTISFIRLAISVLIIIPFFYSILKRELQAAKVHFKLLLYLSLTGVIGFNLLSYWALHYTSAINGSLLNSISPLFIFLLSYLVMGERMQMKDIWAIALSLLGVLFVLTQGSLERLISFQFNVGDLIMLLAVVMWSIYSILIKKMVGKMSSFTIFGYSLCIGFLLMIPAVAVEVMLVPVDTIHLSEWAALIYLGIFPSVCSFLLWNHAVMLIGPSRSSLFLNLIPVFGAAAAFFWLGEVITIFQIIGGVLVFIGIFLSTRTTTKKSIPVLMKER